MSILKKVIKVWHSYLGVTLSLLTMTMTYAVSVTSFSPQGPVETPIKQLKITFSAPMIKIGQPFTSAPVIFTCQLSGRGHWIDDRTWVFDLHRSVVSGQSCQVRVKRGIKSIAGQSVTGQQEFIFSTGMLQIKNIWPNTYGGRIDENQVFLLQYDRRVPVRKPQIFCMIADSPERIPVRRMSEKERNSLIAYFKLEKNTDEIEAVQCSQRLPAGKSIQLALGDPPVPQQLYFTVRPPFIATLNCERENAKADCTPLAPLRLDFSEPVSRQLAQKIRLMTEKGALQPIFSRYDNGPNISSISFSPPFNIKSTVQIILPPNFHDESGRVLLNIADFPLKIRIADMPPLAKFAAAPFGIIEWNSEAAIPITLRAVEKPLPLKSVHVGIGSLAVKKDQDIIYWLKKVFQYHESSLEQKQEGQPVFVQTRSLSLLNKMPGVKKIAIPTKSINTGKAVDKTKLWPFEVVGIPIKEPGLHILEIESQILGKSLLAMESPMYVRTAALVTNLGVHFKQGQDNAAVWVTTLDRAQPVSEAQVNIYDCTGQSLWQGRTNKEGMAFIPKSLPRPACMTPDNDALEGLLIIARKQDRNGNEDVSFVRSIWNQGIESWRFSVPTAIEARPAFIGHTVFDRTLLRAGDTISMKHFLRVAATKGLTFAPNESLPTHIRIVHDGSGQEYRFPLIWRKNRYAETRFALPKEARLGGYSVILEKVGNRQNSRKNASVDEDGISIYSGKFRVEAFRLPVMVGQVSANSKILLGGQYTPLKVSMGYSSGGPAKGLAVQVNAMLQQYYPQSELYRDFSFLPPDRKPQSKIADISGKLILNKASIVLDASGNGEVKPILIPSVDRPYQLLAEASYSDPNGEIQTIAQAFPIWPAKLRIGISVDSWASVGREATVKAVVLDTQERPVAGKVIQIKAIGHTYFSSRKRIVGGFYAYESEDMTKDLGTVCQAKTDKQGFALCKIALAQAGNIELIAETQDDRGYRAIASQSIWASSADEMWFNGSNNDRIDVLAEKSSYKVGEKARFQVRMPFRSATAWIAIERGGLLDSKIINLEGKNPSFELEIKPHWGPNVFVSVLAVRGRVREVPWYSLFTWGWKTPIVWWGAYWNEGKEYQPPSFTVDLGKPAFKYGLTELKVDTLENRLNVTVKADKTIYRTRDMAQVQIHVTLPNGHPAPRGTEVAFAAVDEALLALMPNKSWGLLEAMMQSYSYGVETATAQLQIVGKRHFGRKAMDPGGGGGERPTRELFNTLLLWAPKLTLDDQGNATVKVPLNDSLTRFRFVAIADVGAHSFGTGSTQVVVSQHIQLSSSLPPFIREGDHLQAGVTVRNNSNKILNLNMQARAKGLPDFKPQAIQIPVGEARLVSWPVTIPHNIKNLIWQFTAWASGKERLSDQIRVVQEVGAAIPISTQQATLYQLSDARAIPIQIEKSALPGQGGVKIQLQDRLAQKLPAVQDWFRNYPYTCLEQRLSIIIGLQDKSQWAHLMQELPLYLDEEGLASYFPTMGGRLLQGSDVLTAYILNIADEAQWTIPEAVRNKMLRGLTLFVEGRLRLRSPGAMSHLTSRKLIALEAMARYGFATPKQLTALDIQPQTWSSALLISGLNILQRLPNLTERAKKIAQMERLLRAKLVYQGSALGVIEEKSDPQRVLMNNSDVNAARMLLAVRQLPGWKADLPRLLNGLLSRQQRGVWSTTTANAWGTLAVTYLAQQLDATSTTGYSIMTLDKDQAKIDWGLTPNPKAVLLNWPRTGKGVLHLSHNGKGRPWATVQVLMALPLKAAQSAGYRIKKKMTAITQNVPGQYTQGDILRVQLEIEAHQDMNWVVVNDPIPAGATILGSGLGRDATIPTQEQGPSKDLYPIYIERRPSGYQSYYDYVSTGKFTLSYTIRLNNTGVFTVPATRVEALYAPEVFGAMPNPLFKINPVKQ